VGSAKAKKKTSVFGGLKLPHLAVAKKGFGDWLWIGFLADARAIRCTVPSPTPSISAIFAHESLCARRVAICLASTNRFGLPSRSPLVRAAAKPDRTLQNEV